MAPHSRYARGIAAVAWAESGEVAQAQKLADELAKEYPQDTILLGYWLPMARASIEMNRRNASGALEFLRQAQSYEMGTPTPFIAPMGVLYLRGYAFLAAGQSKEAAAEFQRIVDHPGIVQNSPIGSLAHLGLGRALVAGGEKAKARTAYQDFLGIWKEADADIPILKQAKQEYARLQ